MRLNIEHCQPLLATETDLSKRETITRLVVEQEGQAATEGAARRLELIFPLAPVRRADINPLSGRDVYPSIKDTAAAWEDERMLAGRVDNGKLKITIEGRSCNRLPHVNINASNAETGFDLNQLCGRKDRAKNEKGQA